MSCNVSCKAISRDKHITIGITVEITPDTIITKGNDFSYCSICLFTCNYVSGSSVDSAGGYLCVNLEVVQPDRIIHPATSF